MPKSATFVGNNKNPDDSAKNLMELVHYLDKMEHSKPVYPKWAKFDTARTMSDNNGGVIKF